MRRIFTGLVIALALSCGVPMLGTLLFLYAHAPKDPGQAPVIVVLSGPTILGADLQGETRERVDRGVALFRAGHGDLIAMSGASSKADARPVAEVMGETARAAGVPEDRILIEPEARSTLQNALFVAALPEIDPAAPILLVTHRYHLPRAWASFRWAGFRSVTLVAADRGTVTLGRPVWMEGIKWPANMARAAVYQAALALGFPRARALTWLR